jgi:hypothetical protein
MTGRMDGQDDHKQTKPRILYMKMEHAPLHAIVPGEVLVMNWVGHNFQAGAMALGIGWAKISELGQWPGHAFVDYYVLLNMPRTCH